MEYLAATEAVIATAFAEAIEPALPPDITRWASENVEFDDRSPLPGKFNIRRFAFLREIHEVMSPEHPCREFTIKGSAQWGKTVSIIQPALGSWHEFTPLDSLIVHPTASAAAEWVDNKWMPMRRSAPGLRAIFGIGGKGNQKDAKFNQETLDQNGSLKVASAGSPADLTGTSRRLVIMDDVSKYKNSDKGDPEALAVSRASGFEDAKIGRVSTPLLKGSCRISRAFARSDQRHYYVPCPHCGEKFVLSWENFKANINPENLFDCGFTCDHCQELVRHQHKAEMVANGEWRPHNPNGDHPGFFLWRAYAPQRDWASIAIEYAQVMGWSEASFGSELDPNSTDKVEAETEQTFFNDVLGLEFEREAEALDWEALRNRGESPDPETGQVPLDRGVLPAEGFIFTAGVDCQEDRTEVHLVAFSRKRGRRTIDYKVIPHHISTAECSEALNAILAQDFYTERGLPIRLDMLAIDGGAYTDDVWSWAKSHPWRRVIIVKGSSNQSGPIILPMKFERKKDGKARKRQKRGFMVNVSQQKEQFYTWLSKDDPQSRGYCRFAAGLEDWYYQGLASEHCVLVRQRSGVVTKQWHLVDPSIRNEPLDTMNYAEAAARRRGWDSFTEAQWDKLEDLRGAAPEVSPQKSEGKPVTSKKSGSKKKSFNEVLNGN